MSKIFKIFPIVLSAQMASWQPTWCPCCRTDQATVLEIRPAWRMQTIIFIFIFILLGDFWPGFCVLSECPHCVELQKNSFNFPLQKCYYEYLLTQKHLFHILNKINIFQLYMCQWRPPITPFGQNCPLSSLKCKIWRKCPFPSPHQPRPTTAAALLSRCPLFQASHLVFPPLTVATPAFSIISDFFGNYLSISLVNICVASHLPTNNDHFKKTSKFFVRICFHFSLMIFAMPVIFSLLRVNIFSPNQFHICSYICLVI